MGCLCFRREPGKWRIISPARAALQAACNFTSRAPGAGCSVTERLGVCAAPKDAARTLGPGGFSGFFPHLCCPPVLGARGRGRVWTRTRRCSHGTCLWCAGCLRGLSACGAVLPYQVAGQSPGQGCPVAAEGGRAPGGVSAICRALGCPTDAAQSHAAPPQAHRAQCEGCRAPSHPCKVFLTAPRTAMGQQGWVTGSGPGTSSFLGCCDASPCTSSPRPCASPHPAGSPPCAGAGWRGLAVAPPLPARAGGCLQGLGRAWRPPLCPQRAGVRMLLVRTLQRDPWLEAAVSPIWKSLFSLAAEPGPFPALRADGAD